ncbi:archaetidylserine decarboxylase [Croceibacterium sp. TMG7-5b_MA50]|uniref:archaetidylserine decarboxylase n=1 Tax=Croceibacterium sp. TMG7-5b_MA50 TaxID=3121290 RepID=UPI003221D787
MIDRLKVLLQYALPKQRLTTFAGRIARGEHGRTTQRLIRWFAQRYRVDMSEAAEPDLAGYRSFNAFFTRALHPAARPIAAADFVSPVDGTISQLGAIDDHHILQAKGHRFTVTELVGGEEALAAPFRHGSFANLYLSPRDYHRVHMPCAGTLRRMVHVPGALFSVNPVTARGVPGLFARNERVVCLFDSAEHGPFAMVLVGATIVGSMETVWHGVINAARTGRIVQWSYPPGEVVLDQGAEMGRFLLGSTVILLFRPGTIAFNPAWGPEGAVRLGQRMGDRPA